MYELNYREMERLYDRKLQGLDPVKDHAQITYIQKELEALRLLREDERARQDTLREAYEFEKSLKARFMRDDLMDEEYDEN